MRGRAGPRDLRHPVPGGDARSSGSRVLKRSPPAKRSPKTDGERFFGELKRWTALGYYTSRIGIHDEMEYKGNSLLMEFSGTDPATLRCRPSARGRRPEKP